MAINPKQAPKARSIAGYVFLGAALFAFIKTFSLLSPIVLSFLLIMLVALAINPAILSIRSFTGGRKGATVLVAVAICVVVVMMGWGFIGPMRVSFTNFTREFPGYWERLQKPLIKMEQQAMISEEKLQAEVTIEIEQAEIFPGKRLPAPQSKQTSPTTDTKDAKTIRSRLSEMIQGLIGSFTAMAFNGAQMLVILVTVFFGVLFTLMDPRPILGAIFSMVPERHHDRTLIIMQRIGKFLPRWALCNIVGMLTIGMLVFVSMWPIFGLKDALILGLIAGVLEVVPFIGPILSSVPALLLALGVGGITPLLVLLVYIAIQALENNVILPFVMARGMKLHPVAVIFSMLLCVAAFGVLGVLVAAPLVAIVNILHDELYRKRHLPGVTDADLDVLARKALHEKKSSSR